MDDGEPAGEDPLEWIERTKRRSALRLVIIGALGAVGGLFLVALQWGQEHYLLESSTWGHSIADPAHAREVLRLRVVGGAIGLIGSALAVWGAILLVRMHRRSTRAGLPRATAMTSRR